MLIAGHAAAAGEAPANTLAGVRACLASRADAMEIDVQLCADGVPVLLHDTTLDRTTSLRGAVRDATLAELQAADAGDGEPVPALEDVLRLAGDALYVFCELKSTPGDPAQDDALVDAVIQLVSRVDATDRVAIHSFRPDIVARARSIDPRVPAALIAGPAQAENPAGLFGAALSAGAQAVSVHHSAIEAPLVRLARQHHLGIWAWTVDEPADWQRMIAVGVDGIITNVPAAARSRMPPAQADMLAGT